METYFCTCCFNKIETQGPGFIFWASYEQNGWGIRSNPLQDLPVELIEKLKTENFNYESIQ